MRDQLRALAKLAEIDGSARDLETEERELPERIEAMRGDVGRLEAMLTAEREAIAEAESLRKARSADLQERNDALSRAKAKGAKARSLKEVDAAEREVDSNRRSIKELQQQLNRLAETVGAKQESLAERERQFEEAKAMLAEQETAANARLEEVKAELAKVTEGRDAVVEKLPKRIVKRYERLRSRIGTRHKPVSVIADASCVSCRMAVPAQLYIELQRGDEIHECPHCRAYLVHKHLLVDTPEEA